MPGSGMDKKSPWRQGPDWKAGNITAMERCIVVKEKSKIQREEATDTWKETERRALPLHIILNMD